MTSGWVSFTRHVWFVLGKHLDTFALSYCMAGKRRLLFSITLHLSSKVRFECPGTGIAVAYMFSINNIKIKIWPKLNNDTSRWPIGTQNILWFMYIYSNTVLWATVENVFFLLRHHVNVEQQVNQNLIINLFIMCMHQLSCKLPLLWRFLHSTIFFHTFQRVS